MRPTFLRCESLVDPLGIDLPQPWLSWLPPFDQTAYQIVVTGGRKRVWETGRIKSDKSLHVEYAGPPLTAGKHYHGRVRVWPRTGKPSAWSECIP